jgi:hypothetical protein
VGTKGKQAPRGYGAGERELKMDAAQDGERARSHGTRSGSLTILGRVHLEFALAGAVAPRCLLALGEQVTDLR